jgi:hypothetical protein
VVVVLDEPKPVEGCGFDLEDGRLVVRLSIAGEIEEVSFDHIRVTEWLATVIKHNSYYLAVFSKSSPSYTVKPCPLDAQQKKCFAEMLIAFREFRKRKVSS